MDSERQEVTSWRGEVFASIRPLSARCGRKAGGGVAVVVMVVGVVVVGGAREQWRCLGKEGESTVKRDRKYIISVL